MITTKPAVAAVQGLLISPAVLFMGALTIRNLPPQYELARNAQLIVMWYAARQWTLWTLLITLPLAALVAGGLALLSAGTNVERSAQRGPSAKIFVATATSMAGGILGIVVLHMLAN